MYRTKVKKNTGIGRYRTEENAGTFMVISSTELLKGRSSDLPCFSSSREMNRGWFLSGLRSGCQLIGTR